MQAFEILDRIHSGEDSTTQFKQDVTDANRLAEELVAFSNAEGGLLLIGVGDDGAESTRLFADEEVLYKSQLGDINTEAVYAFLEQDNPTIADELREGDLQLVTVLENLELVKQGHLTLAGNLLFGKVPQKYTPSFYIDCVHFNGDDVGVEDFIAKTRVKGSLKAQYDGAMHFIRNNLRRIRLDEGFNAQTRLEIDERIFSELLVNALVHRDYYIQSSIKVFIFDDRVEIISPGKLVNSLTVDKIKAGLAIHRNPILNSVGTGVLPYSGYGSGIKRVIKLNRAVMFVDDRNKEEFRCVIPR